MAERVVVYESAPILPGEPHRLASVISLGAVLAGWEAITRLQLVSPLFLPPPTVVLGEGVRMLASGELSRHVAISLARVGLGFAVGAAVGTALGLLLGGSRLAEAIGHPLIAAAYPIPKIALLPLLILWLGIGEMPKVAMIALGVFFPVVINTYAGVRDTDALMIKAATSLGAAPGQVVLRVVLPSALPMILAGYRLGAGIALLLVVSAEMINATTGIGFLILNSGDLMLTSKLMVGILLLSLLGLGSTWGLRALETYLAPWKEDVR